MSTLRAFHGSEKTKAFYVERMKAHRVADEIVQGLYWDGKRGCAVGCALQISPDDIRESIYQRYETELGIPLILAYLQDGIFEGLAIEDAKEFPLRFLEAVNVGADLSGVSDKFMLWLLYGVLQYVSGNDASVIETVAALYRRKIEGEIISNDEWQTARAAALAAADAAVAATYATYAIYAALAAATAIRATAARAAARAADAAADAADAAYVAYADARKEQADKLLALISEVE